MPNAFENQRTCPWAKLNGGLGEASDTEASASARRVSKSRLPSWAVFGVVLGIALAVPYYASVEGILDFAKHTVGRDFVNLWTAGALI